MRKTRAQHVLLARCGCAVGAQDALEALGNVRPNARLNARPNARLKSEKIRWMLPKFGKESVDLPDFVKDSVAVLQILLTF